MAEKYIINMPLKTTPDDTDLMIIEDSQDTKRMTWSNLIKPIKDLIGNLASLTTNHKTSVVGAINEIDNTVAALKTDHQNLNSSNLLWSGSANSGQLTYSQSADNFIGLSIETNHTTNPGSQYRGGIFIPMTLASVAYYPVSLGPSIHWIRISIAETYLSIAAVENESLSIVTIRGIGKKPTI